MKTTTSNVAAKAVTTSSPLRHKEDAMQMHAQTESVVSLSKTQRLTGFGLSTLAVLFLAFDGVIKLMGIPPVVQSFGELGFPVSAAVGIGILELACVAAYVVPRTSILGALLLTGYLGGAIAIHVRVGNPLFSHALFPVYVGLFVWGGLFLREPRLRALLPLRRMAGTPATERPARWNVAGDEVLVGE